MVQHGGLQNLYSPVRIRSSPPLPEHEQTRRVTAVVAVLVGRRARVALDDPTERERAVLALTAEGLSNQAIGDRLSMARKTVEAHIANIFSKLELPPTADDHRRVLAVLAHLRGSG